MGARLAEQSLGLGEPPSTTRAVPVGIGLPSRVSRWCHHLCGPCAGHGTASRMAAAGQWLPGYGHLLEYRLMRTCNATALPTTTYRWSAGLVRHLLPDRPDMARESPVSRRVRGPGPRASTWIAPCALEPSFRPPGSPPTSWASPPSSPVSRASGRAQVSPPAVDTYETARIRELVENGAQARRAAGERIVAYEAEIRDRIRVGLGGGVFRRERTLLDRARSARVLWTREGTDLVLWTGGEQRVPIAGLDTSADETYLREFAEDLAEGERPIAMLDPREEVLSFGRDEHEVVEFFLHPLSDTASAHYRYFTGDTLTISFVGDAAPVRLEEVRVRPRRADARLVAASLWFDLETGQMARASMRPTRPMTLGMDLDTEGGSLTAQRAPPPRPLQFEVQYITIDYLLQDREWWLARRFAFGGEARIGRWARLPFLIETTLSDYSVNPAEPELTREAAEAEGWLSGWSAQAASGDSGAEPDTVIAMVPPLDSLETTGLLPEPGGLGAGAAIDPGAELTRIRRDLESIISDVAVSYRPRLGLGSWRFNRVEGLSAGAATTVPVTARVDATLTGRIGVADWQPRGELSVRRRADESSVHLAAYRRLADGSDFDDPLDLSSSVKALVSGNDRGQFYDAWGAELGLGWTGPGREAGVRIFAEEHRAVEAETSFHLMKPLTKASAAANIGAEEGRLSGIAATVRWSWGTDPADFSAVGGACR